MKVPSTSAKVIADSISTLGIRLTTLEVVMHRFVLAEFNTHRVFSRNSASSRAIPIEKRVKSVLQHCAYPVEWGANQPGMQAEKQLARSDAEKAAGVWTQASIAMASYALQLAQLGVHKQLANRLVEPFLWHTVVVTSTDWENFFMQRCSPLAQPEIRCAAEAMREALSYSEPRHLSEEEWHLPYVQPEEYLTMDFADTKRLSVARCARVSYLTHDGRRDLVADYKLYDRLLCAEPPHASPFEHVARPLTDNDDVRHGNFRGWIQLRHEVGL
ncbi:MAG: hypothetical protein E6Q97_26575 [Desulfurellales bacterium]|nr:MAG: hypothetical protein E6Q97_26575 [Desulfurellales bacterium]